MGCTVNLFPFSNHNFEFRHQSGYRIKRLRILPVQSGLWHSLLSAQWPRHSDPPWAAAEHCLVLCWVPLAQVTEQSLQELHSCHCPSTEAPTTTQQACPMWREKDGRQKWEEIFRSLFSLRLKANKTDIKWKAKNDTATRFWRIFLLVFCFDFFQSRISQNSKSRIKHKQCFGYNAFTLRFRLLKCQRHILQKLISCLPFSLFGQRESIWDWVVFTESVTRAKLTFAVWKNSSSLICLPFTGNCG